MHQRTSLRHWNTREKHTHDMHTRITRVCYTRTLRARIGVYAKIFAYSQKENANDFHKQFAPRRNKRQTNNSIYENNNDVHSG